MRIKIFRTYSEKKNRKLKNLLARRNKSDYSNLSEKNILSARNCKVEHCMTLPSLNYAYYGERCKPTDIQSCNSCEILKSLICTITILLVNGS